MPEVPFSNRELDTRFDTLREHMRGFEDFVSGKFEELITQTTKTNGRVRWAEKMIYTALGGLGVLSLVVFPLIWALVSSGKL